MADQDDIIGDVMDLRKIRKLRSEIADLRGRGGIKCAELQSLARRLGRRLASRGKEPNWVHKDFPDSWPVSIPDHRGDLNRFTARGILDQLEGDLDRYEELLSSRDQSN